MKKTFYLIIALMLALTITGCSTTSSKDTEMKEKTEEKESNKKKDNKKEEKKEENKKENSMNISTVDNILSYSIKDTDYEGTVDMVWVDGSLNNMEFNITVSINKPDMTDEAFDATAELTKQLMISQYGVNENTEGITFKTSTDKEKRTITFNFYMDLTKASKDILSKFGLNLSEEDLKSSIDVVKADMEKNAFTCQKKYN